MGSELPSLKARWAFRFYGRDLFDGFTFDADDRFFLGAACVEGVWVGVGDGSALIGGVTTGSSFVLFICHCAL